MADIDQAPDLSQATKDAIYSIMNRLDEGDWARDKRSTEGLRLLLQRAAGYLKRDLS